MIYICHKCFKYIDNKSKEAPQFNYDDKNNCTVPYCPNCGDIMEEENEKPAL